MKINWILTDMKHIEAGRLQCIFCLDYKLISEFNEEHVFQAGMNGKFKIKNCCIDCNSKINDKIDAPFLKTKLINTNRALFSIPNRDGDISSIDDIFILDKFITISGEELKVIYDKKTKSYILPPQLYKGGEIMDPAIYHAKCLKNPNRYQNARELILIGEFGGTELFDESVIIKAVGKIAYEFATNKLCSLYVNQDPMAEQIRNYLLYNIGGLIGNGDINLPDLEAKTSSFSARLISRCNELWINVSILGVINYNILISENSKYYPEILDNIILHEQTFHRTYNITSGTMRLIET